MVTCNHDCLNCIYDDCIVDDITLEEEKEISNRSKEDGRTAQQKLNREKELRRNRDPVERAYQHKKYYESHKEHCNQKSKQYREENKEHISRLCADWREKNAERNRELKRKWQEKNKEKRKEINRRYREKQKAKQAELNC